MSSHESKRAAGRKSSSTEPMPAICESNAMAATSAGSTPLSRMQRLTACAAVV